MAFSESSRIGNYHYEPGTLFSKRAGRQTYIIGFACAYNAFGLIGSEHNGIFVLNNTKKDVVLDEVMRLDSGFYGPSHDILVELKRIRDMTPSKFLRWIANDPRTRDQYKAKA